MLRCTSFPGQIRTAIDNGWDAEIYTWKNSYNKKKFQELIDEYGKEKVRITCLDKYYYNVVYIKGGAYNGVATTWRGVHKL